MSPTVLFMLAIGAVGPRRFRDTAMFHRLQYFFVPYLHHVSPTGPVFPGHAVDVQALIDRRSPAREKPSTLATSTCQRTVNSELTDWSLKKDAASSATSPGVRQGGRCASLRLAALNR